MPPLRNARWGRKQARSRARGLETVSLPNEVNGATRLAGGITIVSAVSKAADAIESAAVGTLR